jgi:hypothetical protein
MSYSRSTQGSRLKDVRALGYTSLNNDCAIESGERFYNTKLLAPPLDEGFKTSRRNLQQDMVSPPTWSTPGICSTNKKRSKSNRRKVKSKTPTPGDSIIKRKHRKLAKKAMNQFTTE